MSWVVLVTYETSADLPMIYRETAGFSIDAVYPQHEFSLSPSHMVGSHEQVHRGGALECDYYFHLSYDKRLAAGVWGSPSVSRDGCQGVGD